MKNEVYNYFVNGRVNTMQQAVNLYEEEMHRMRMENLAKYNARVAEQTRTVATIAAINSTFR